MTSIEYNDFLMCSIKPFTQIRRHKDLITSIDYSFSSNIILTGGNDDLISIYSLKDGKAINEIYNNFYGVKYVCFTNEVNKILCAGKSDYRIMVIDTTKKSIDFSFFGHNKPIDSIIFSHQSSMFISNSIEEQISIIWNYKSLKCYCIIKSSINACFDYFGDIVSSISIQQSNNFTKVNLYKIRKDSLSTAPTLLKSLSIESKSIEQVKISNNAKYIICFSKTELYIYELLSNHLSVIIKTQRSNFKCFDITSDSKYIGVIDIDDCLWYFKITGELVKKEKEIDQKCQVIKFFNEYAVFAIGSDKLVLFTPDITG